MSEVIPNGIYESLWSWIEASRSHKLPDHELQQLFYQAADIQLNKAIGLDAQQHPNFTASAAHTPSAYVGVLPQGRYWVSEDKTIALITPDNKLIWDVSMQIHFPKARHPVFLKSHLPPARYTEETIAVLTYVFDDNYYHWFAEVVARIHLVEKSGIPIDKYLINEHGSGGFQAETLSLLGITEDRIIRSKRGMHLKANRLVIPSLEMYSLLPYTPTFPAQWATRYIRSELLNKVSPDRSTGAKRIYISRGDAAYRYVTNEKDVAELLQAKGFTIVTPGYMSVADQIRMFASAEFIVAPHGAGLANLMFCTPGTGLLELFSPNYVNPTFWYLSNQAGINYYYLIGEGARLPLSTGLVDVGYRVEHITVDLDALSAMLKRIGL